MAVHKRKGSPHWQIEFSYLGEEVRRSSGTSRKARAEALERQWRNDIHERQKLGKLPSITLGEAVIRYSETILVPTAKSKKKLQRDQSNLTVICDAFGKDRLLSNLKQSEIAKWRDEHVTKRKVKPSTANRLYAVLRAIINMARDQWNVDAPMLKLKGLKEPPGRVRYLTPDEETSLLTACAVHVRRFVTFLMDSGARKGEAENLSWDRIEWDAEQKRATVLLFATETKSNRARRVPLTLRASAILNELRAEFPGLPNVFNYHCHKTKKVRPLGNIRKGFDAACRRAGITDFHIHDCRHHFASRLAQNGASLHEIKELLGHQKITMTMRYAHLCQSNLDRAVARLDPAPNWGTQQQAVA